MPIHHVVLDSTHMSFWERVPSSTLPEATLTWRPAAVRRRERAQGQDDPSNTLSRLHGHRISLHSARRDLDARASNHQYGHAVLVLEQRRSPARLTVAFYNCNMHPPYVDSGLGNCRVADHAIAAGGGSKSSGLSNSARSRLATSMDIHSIHTITPLHQHQDEHSAPDQQGN